MKKKIDLEKESQEIQDLEDLARWAAPQPKIWEIHYRDREYANVMGDPILTRITAETKEKAEDLARSKGFDYPAGVWAVEIKPSLSKSE